MFCDTKQIKIVFCLNCILTIVFKMFSRQVIIRLVALTAILQSSDCSEFLHRVPRQNFDEPFNIQGATGSSSPFNSNLAQQDSTDASWPLSTPDMPKITNIQVQCEKTHMRVSIDFDRPFSGLVFSKGHFSDPSCVHLQPGSGTTSSVFEIRLNECGTTSSGTASNDGQPNPVGSFVESTIIVQYDPLVQEVWDQARKLRCTWYDYYEKSVTFRPFQVNMLNAVTANFLGDNLQCWMQIQSGKGPWSSEVSGIVKIGQTMTMVLGIKDEENKFDMIVRNCVAHDGKRTPIQLVNELGCIIRPKIMSKFHKIKNFGPSANVVSYAYFQAFKFPDSMNVHFQCVIQVCRFNCPEPVCPESEGGPGLDTYSAATLDSYSVQPQSPTIDSYSVDPVQESYTQPQVSFAQQPQVASYTQSPPIALPQDTYTGQFTAPQGPPPPPPPPPPVSASSSYVEPRTPGSAAIIPAVAGYEGPARRRFSNGPLRNNRPDSRFGQRQGRQEQIHNPHPEFRQSPQYDDPFYPNIHVNHRFRREVNTSNGIIETMSVIRVLSTDDVAFRLNGNGNDNVTSSGDVVQQSASGGDWPTICVTFTNTSGLLFITFLCIILVSVVTSTVIGCRRRRTAKKLKAAKLAKEEKFRTEKVILPPKSLTSPPTFPTPIPQKPPCSESSTKKMKK